MGPEKRICRLCLQIIGEDVPYSALTNNAKALRNLEHISINTVKNLGLTEEPLICKLCDNKLEELSTFKETAIANEAKIQSNQKVDFDAFLKTLSEDVEAICRVCLKASQEKDELQKSWHDNEGLFSQCNIQMNEDIAVPAKICEICHATLQSTADFISLCSKNEKFIEELAAKKEKLTANDLITAFATKSDTDINIKTENNNNKLRKAEDKVNTTQKRKQPAKSKRISGVGRVRNKKQEPSSSGKESKRSSAKKNSITKYLMKNSNDGDSQEAISHVTKSQKTYKRKKSTLKKLYSLELPSTSKGGPKDSIERELMLKHMNEQLEQMHISIDAIPVSNISDITLNVDEEGLVQGEVTSECNVTQELIDVLEGRLNKEPSYTLHGLEAELEDGGGIQDNNCDNKAVIRAELESKSKKGKRVKWLQNTVADQVINDLDVTKSTVRRTYSKTSKHEPTNHSNQNATNKKTTSEALKVFESAVSVKEEQLPVAKQKSIITSFKEVLNMKLMKNKGKTGNPIADQNMLLASAEQSKNNINEQNNSSVISTKKVNRAAKKVNNKIKENSNDNGPPKKKAKRTAEEQPDETTKLTDKSGTKSPIEIIPLPPNDASIVPKGNADHSSDDDEFVEEDVDKLENRSVTVTIIKGKKRSNKAQLDKTWQELTGKPTHKSPSGNTQQPGLEIEVVGKKRGRPPLPSHLKKQRYKPAVVWLYCDQCPFKTYTQNSFVQHQLIHNIMSNIQTFHCDVCRYTTSNSELMQQHKARHESVHLIYKCVFCDEIFKKKVSCMYHTLRHDDQDVASQFYCLVYNGVTEEEHFECYQCDYQNVEESTMPDHVIDHSIQKPKNPIVAKFKCNLCQYRTKSEDLLKRHKTLHQSKLGKSARKNSQSEIKKEVEPVIKTEPGAEEDDEPPFLKCDQCHYMTRNKRSMANHRGLKHNRTIHPHAQGKEAATQAVAEDRPMFYCNECSYSTHRKLNLPRHSLVHRTKENMEFFECPHCLFETKHRRSYTRHMEAIHAVIV